MPLIVPTRRMVSLLLIIAVLSAILIAVAPGLWPVGLLVLATAFALFLADAVVAMRSPLSLEEIGFPTRLFIRSDSRPFMATLNGPVGGHALARIDLAGPVIFDPETSHADQTLSAEFDQQTGQAVVTFNLSGLRRGIGMLRCLTLRLEGPTRLATVQRRFALDHRVAVVPNLPRSLAQSIDLVLSDTAAGAQNRRQLSVGGEFEALAEYQPGRDPRHIHWRQSARHGSLLVKDYRDEQNHNVVLAFDTGFLMSEQLDQGRDETRLDVAIEAGLTLAATALRQGDAVGLYAFGPSIDAWAVPRNGGRALLSILADKAASLPYHRTVTNFTAGLGQLEMRLKRRSLILLFTEFTDSLSADLMAEGLARLARTHVVLFVTLTDDGLRQIILQPPDSPRALGASVVAGDLMRDRHLVFERLRRDGVDVVETDPGRFAGDIISQYLGIKYADRL
ncbi:MAG: DUF58 domain-containing protein [Pseudomonadota bacterium]